MQNYGMYLVSQILLFVVQLAVTSLIVIIHRMTPAIVKWIDRHTTNTERKILQQIGSEAIAFAEHTFATSDAQTKLNGALNYALSVTKLKKLDVTPDEVLAVLKTALPSAQ